mgnify:CR=1 FL=1
MRFAAQRGRDIGARARIEGAALVSAGPTRTARVQSWVESGRMADLAPALEGLAVPEH